MSPPPPDPKIYHITHIRNLPGILRDGCLWSDAERLSQGLTCEVVGMQSIKRRRLGIEVSCNAGTRVGDYVPFYFCPRSVMLYLLHMGNHPELHYLEGQRPILHLQADLNTVIDWARGNAVQWTFTDLNAADGLCSFYNEVGQLHRVDWDAVGARDWRDGTVRGKKQAEFLALTSFPWTLVERIGVRDEDMKAATERALEGTTHRPQVDVRRDWYY